MITRWLVTLFAALVICWGPSQAHAESSNLPIRISAGSATISAQAGLQNEAEELASKASEWLGLIQEDLEGLAVPQRVDLRLVKDASDLNKASPPGRNVPSWAAGVMFPGTDIIVVARKKDGELLDYISTARHELAHLALDSALKDKAPRWLHEGFAYLHSSEWSPARVNTLVGMAWSGSVYPLSSIDSHFPSQENAVHKAYAQSYDFVAYLAKRGHYADSDDDGNRWPFRVFLKEVSQGSSMEDASQFAFGVGFMQLQAEWYESLRARYLFVPSSLVGVLAWAVAALLLVLGYIRKRKKSVATLDRWEREDHQSELRKSALLP